MKLINQMKQTLKDIFRNYWFPILAGIVGVILVTLYVQDFSDAMWQYYLLIAIASGGGVACVIYGLIKLFKK